MIRAFALATFAAAAFAVPAIAETAAKPAAVAAHAAELSNLAAENQIHRLLASQGYVQITEFGRDDDGRWTAAAVKDGKTVFVAVAMPSRTAAAPSN